MEEREDSIAKCFNHLRELLHKNSKGLQAQAAFAAEH
jgi:hypothetical protein